MTYGFWDLNLHKLFAEMWEIDTKKIKLFNSFGFKQEAELREHYFYQGKYHKSYILGLLRSECEK